MILAVDVHYLGATARAAGVGFATWTDADAAVELVVTSATPPAPYQPGQFYRRELPHLLAVVEAVVRHRPVATVIVDGHVWLDHGRPGLGAHLHQALAGASVVVGVAKSAFRGGPAIAVVRGTSRQPLYVTAAGADPATVAAQVAAMHGPHRLPTLLKHADRLARGHERPDAARAPGGRAPAT